MNVSHVSKHAAVMFAAALLFAGLAASFSSHAADVEAGRKKAEACGACHGADGNGNAAMEKMFKVPIKPLSSEEVQKKSDADLKKIIAEGQGKMKPVTVPSEIAICNQNIVEGDKVDIRMFPAQRMWPLDGGMYLGTADAVITKDPESGRVNVGTYRMMIKGPREIGVYTSPGKDGGSDRDKWWKMGKPAPIAAALASLTALDGPAAAESPVAASVPSTRVTSAP